MPDEDLEDCKKQIAAEMKTFARQTERSCKQARSLREEEAELAKKSQPADDGKQRKLELRKALQDLEKSYQTQMDTASDRLNRILKTAVPTDQQAVPEWQKNMAPWYRNLLDKEPGLDLGKGLRLTGQISIKDKKVMLILNGKF